MADVFPCFDDVCFDQTDTKMMGQALDRACEALNWTAKPPVLKEGLASRIIEIAKTGERDPDRLCSQVLRAMGLNR